MSTLPPKSVWRDGDVIKIQWLDDAPNYPGNHTTSLSIATLRSLLKHGNANTWPSYAPSPRKAWEAEEYAQFSDFDYEAYMNDDQVLSQALTQLHTHGLLFVSNVPESETSVSTIGERIGPIKNTFYGYTWDVRSVPKAKNVAYTSQDLGFHMDLLYMEQPPQIQLLHCIRSSSSGGASLFTDSYKAAADLLAADVDTFKTLVDVEASFHYNHPDSNLYHQSRPVFEVLEKDYRQTFRALYNDKPVNILDYLTAVNWSPPFQAPFAVKPRHRQQQSKTEVLGPLNSRVADWHKAAQQFNALVHRPSGIYERLMKPGECVIFDNRRVLHARKAFEAGDAGKERWLRGAYLDKDPYLSKMRVLHGAAK
ncbi:uncharacterized protein LTR77_001431 [Saxophila tyrrhenica]|uniref:TauD/TfdA-like domain-containing protein n=1 Tax=Saxophila tyrrhenica TaxID=1690608 RepID=A0AAV9PN90_9PEZI|nr:hypothetical protein LTR77_001431 [Saxophila tyrrhenica]